MPMLNQTIALTRVATIPLACVLCYQTAKPLTTRRAIGAKTCLSQCLPNKTASSARDSDNRITLLAILE